MLPFANDIFPFVSVPYFSPSLHGNFSICLLFPSAFTIIYIEEYRPYRPFGRNGLCGSQITEKLERWGRYILLRPDPQVIWNTKKERKEWKHLNGHYHRSSKGGGEWEFFDLPQEWSIHYHSLTFHLKPFSFKHTGLFPEQAVNWDWFSDLIQKSGC